MTTADTLTVRRASTVPSTVPAGTAGPLRMCTTRTSASLVNVAPVATCPAGPAGNVRDLFVNTYYVDQDSVAQVGFPALRVWSLTAPTVIAPDFVDAEVIAGVEDMQVQFGIEPLGAACIPGAYTAQQYVDAVPAAGWPAAPTYQVVAVRIWLLVRADALEPGFTDNTIYQYGNRSTAKGTVATLNAAGSAGKAYQPRDGFRRLLVSRTVLLRDAGC